MTNKPDRCVRDAVFHGTSVSVDTFVTWAVSTILSCSHRGADVRQLQKLVARTDCGLGALERDLAALEATAQSSRQALDTKSAELATAEARAADLQRQLQQVLQIPSQPASQPAVLHFYEYIADRETSALLLSDTFDMVRAARASMQTLPTYLHASLQLQGELHDREADLASQSQSFEITRDYLATQVTCAWRTRKQDCRLMKLFISPANCFMHLSLYRPSRFRVARSCRVTNVMALQVGDLTAQLITAQAHVQDERAAAAVAAEAAEADLAAATAAAASLGRQMQHMSAAMKAAEAAADATSAELAALRAAAAIAAQQKHQQDAEAALLQVSWKLKNCTHATRNGCNHIHGPLRQA